MVHINFSKVDHCYGREGNTHKYDLKRKLKDISGLPKSVCSRVFRTSSVLKWGARKHSTQFDNHPGCLTQTWEALPCLFFLYRVAFLFNFMAKWTSLLLCPTPHYPQVHSHLPLTQLLFILPQGSGPLHHPSGKHSRSPKGHSALRHRFGQWDRTVVHEKHTHTHTPYYPLSI